MASSIPNSSSNIEKYPFPLGIEVRDIFSFKLSKENYFRWRPLMMGLIKSQGLLDFIKAAGGISMKMKNSEHREAWQITDALLQSWILGTVNEDLLPNIESLGTFKDMWTALETLLSPPQQTTSSTVPIPQEITSSRAPNTEEPTTGEAASQYHNFKYYILKRDWESAIEFVKHNPDAVTTYLEGGEMNGTALALTLSVTTENHFAKKLLELMSPLDAALPDAKGCTPLHYAARTGNMEAAKLLVKKNPNLPNVRDMEGLLPIHAAAIMCHRNMVLYLFHVTDQNLEPKLLAGDGGKFLILCLIETDQCDIALSLIQNNYWGIGDNVEALSAIARRKSAFKSGAELNLWQRLIYPYAGPKLEAIAYQSSGGDIENSIDVIPFPAYVKQKLHYVLWKLPEMLVKQKLHYVFWKLTEMLVPQMKYVRKIKGQHTQAHELLKHLCSQVKLSDDPEGREEIQRSLHTAAQLGIVEVIEELVSAPIASVFSTNEDEQHVFHITILNRQEKVFNLICQLPNTLLSNAISATDSSDKTCLDMVACLKSEQRLKLKQAGAALQMQRELQWYKAVEKLAMDARKMDACEDYSSYRKVFSETHEELRKDGEEWMKATANSCTIVSALIVTIMFAAAITVPGGNNSDSGAPNFSKSIAFLIFGMSDAIALFSSTSSLLAFLSILTLRYAEEDFLIVLPRRLIVGLTTLFISIITMMIAFGATLYLVFGYKKPWILAPIAVLACAPGVQFMSSQFPLLYDMITSTYGQVFCRQSDRIIF